MSKMWIPMELKEYTVISTFAGCGGSSLGYKWAGFKELLAIDFDKNAHETFKLNFDCPTWLRDIKEITANEILEFCEIKKGELDILDGSPPCQGFSTAGKRVVADDRNDLFKEYVRLIDGIQPKVFVMENVSGMIKGKMKGCFIEIMQTLKALNYQVKAKLMNAKYYNVPQSRDRVIFIGVRNDLNIEPCYPEPNNKVITVCDVDCKDRVKAKYSNKRYGDVIQKQNKPASTLAKLQRLFYDKNEMYGVDSLKAFCSFPSDFKFCGSYSDIKNRLGNAVMPKFMQAIAENIKLNILDKVQ